MKNYILTIVSCILVLSCSSSKEQGGYEMKDTSKQLGEYVYVDASGCLHVDRHCLNLCLNKSEKGNWVNYQVSFVKAGQLADFPESFCARCVSDRDYKKLDEFIYKNIQNRSTWRDIVIPDSVAAYDNHPIQ